MKQYLNLGKNPTARTALNVVGLLLVVGLVAPFVVYSVPAVVGADESYVVLTGSMSPAIEPGDVVIVQSVPANEITEGDVITFRQNSAQDVPVTHRVVAVTQSESGAIAFQTKGDNNEDVDNGLVTADLLVGRVMVTLPYVGRIIEFVNSPYGFVGLVVVPIFLLVLNEAYTFVVGARKSSTAAATTEDSTGGTSADAQVDGSVADTASAGIADTPAGTTDVTVAAPTEAATDPAGGLVLTENDFTFTAASLLALSAYSSYMAYLLRDALSIAVAVGADALLLLVVVVRLFAFRTPSDRPSSAGTDSPATDGGVEEFEFDSAAAGSVSGGSNAASADAADAEVSER